MRDPLGRLPIRIKLPLAYLLVCSLVVIAGGFLVSRFARDSIHDQIELRLASDTRAVALGIQSGTRLLGRRVEDFASDGLIREHLERIVESDSDVVRTSLARHLRVNKIPLVECFVDGMVVTNDGRIVASARDRRSTAARASVKRALATDALSIGELQPANPVDDYPTFCISTPVRDLAGQRILGRFIARVHVGCFLASVADIGTGMNGAAEHRIRLVDQGGAELVIPAWFTDVGSGNRELVNEAAGFVLHDGRGAGSPPPERSGFEYEEHELGAGWSVRVGVDVNAAMEPIRRLESRYIATSLLIMGVAFFAILATVGFMIIPLNRLRSAAERVAAGDPGVRVDVTSSDEIGVVGASFNAMASAIDTRTRQLERKRDELDAVVSSMVEGVCLLSADGRVVLSNASAEPIVAVLTGCRGEGDGDGERCEVRLRSTAAGPQSCELEIEGRTYDVRAGNLPAGGAVGGRLVVSRDVTEHREMNRRQAFHERMAVVGELSSAVAHEINNPLASISMYAQMLADEMPEGSPYHEHVDVIRRNTGACKHAIRDLLDNVRGGATEVAEFDLRDLADDVVRFLGPLARSSGVAIEARVPADEVLVTGDETRLRQVVVNLTMNAVQACGKDGGGIVIEVTSDRDEAIIDVVDRGCGIAPEIRERVFDPFFTTKGIGEGTGLGLPTARRTAESHGGSLTLEPAVEGETCFRMRLPLLVEPSGLLDGYSTGADL